MKIRMIIAGLLLFIPIAFSVSYAGAFDLFGTSCSKLSAEDQKKSSVCVDQKDSTPNPITDTIKKVTNLIALITGISAVIIIIVSGFMFVTAGGGVGGQRAGDNPAKAAKARSALSASLIGLVIVALAWTIVTFITDKFIHS